MILKKLSSWLQRLSTGWVTLVALLVFLLFTALVLPGQAAASPAGADWTPDLSFFYTADELYRLAEAYGEQGRAAYIEQRFTFDLVWPVVYTAFLVTAIGWLFRRAFAPGSPWQFANLAPVLGMIFDYLENISASLVMARYPAETPLVDGLAPIFTAVKWLLLGGSFGLLLIGMAGAVWQRLRGKTR
jgi:hypothetical protein